MAHKAKTGAGEDKVTIIIEKIDIKSFSSVTNLLQGSFVDQDKPRRHKATKRNIASFFKDFGPELLLSVKDLFKIY